jgi:hypothetical protein
VLVLLPKTPPTTPANALLTLPIVIADNLNGEVADRLRDVLVEGGDEYFSGCPKILCAKDCVFNGEVGGEGADESDRRPSEENEPRKIIGKVCVREEPGEVPTDPAFVESDSFILASLE